MEDAIAPADRPDQITQIYGWLLGLEDALMAIVDEIEKLTARLDDAERTR